MSHNLIILLILGISKEIHCQRHIIGSRLLNFDNDVRFISPSLRQARNSKDIEFEKKSSDKISNIRTVKDSTFDSIASTNSDTRVNEIDDFEECVPLDKCESLDWLVQNIDTLPNLSSSQVVEKIKSRICGFYGRIPKVLCPIDDDNEIDDSGDYEDDYDYVENDDSNETTQIPDAHIESDKLSNQGFLFSGSSATMKNETQSNETDTSDRVGNALNGLGGGSADDLGGVSTDEAKDEAFFSDLNSEEVLGRAIFKDIGAPRKRRCRGSLLIHHTASNGEPLEDFKQLRLRGKSYRQMRKLRNRNIVQMQTHGNCCWQLHSRANFQGQEETVYNGYNIVPEVHPRSIKSNICS